MEKPLPQPEIQQHHLNRLAVIYDRQVGLYVTEGKVADYAGTLLRECARRFSEINNVLKRYAGGTLFVLVGQKIDC